jgi:hypothetical protein
MIKNRESAARSRARKQVGVGFHFHFRFYLQLMECFRSMFLHSTAQSSPLQSVQEISPWVSFV